MTFSKIIFLVPNFVKLVPEIFFVALCEIIRVLKELDLKIPFILNRD